MSQIKPRKLREHIAAPLTTFILTFFFLSLSPFTTQNPAHASKFFPEIGSVLIPGFSTHAVLRTSLPKVHVLSRERHDLTHVPFITIDPADAHELDDAVYVESINAETKRIKVAIADPVSLLIKSDPKVLSQAVEQVYTRYEERPVRPLFPDALTAQTSLLPGKHCPAVVVEYEINQSGQISPDTQIYLATMISCAKLSYDEVNAHFTNLSHLNRESAAQVDQIAAAAIALRKARLGESSQKITGEEAVAELMIRTNMIIAEYMRDHGLGGIYRVQDAIGERAYYTQEPRTHASMNGLYTHFTSPLRRLPDCLVHATLFYPEFWSKLATDPENASREQLLPNILKQVNEVEDQLKDEDLDDKKLKAKKKKQRAKEKKKLSRYLSELTSISALNLQLKGMD